MLPTADELAAALHTAAAIGLSWSEIQAQANGWLVVEEWNNPAWPRLDGQKDFDHQYFSSITEAADYYMALENGEYRHRSPVCIIPCRDGVPCGPTLSSSLVGQLMREARKC